MKSKKCLQVQHKVPPHFHLFLNHFVLSYALTIAWTSTTQVQPKCAFQCIHRCTFLCIFIQILKCTFGWNCKSIISTLNCIIKRILNRFVVVPVALSCVSPGAVKSSFLLSFFNWPDFSSICTLKSIFESSLKCISFTLSFAISFTSGGAICVLLVQFKADHRLHSQLYHNLR